MARRLMGSETPKHEMKRRPQRGDPDYILDLGVAEIPMGTGWDTLFPRLARTKRRAP